MSRHVFILLLFTLILTGCETFSAIWGDDDNKVKADEVVASEEHGDQEGLEPKPSYVYGISNKELELKVAKLYARVDELEGEVLRQKERSKILEKGLMLGVIPKELMEKELARFDEREEDEDKKTQKSSKDQKQESTIIEEQGNSKPLSEALTADEERIYQDKLSKSQALFNAGDYGQAIAAFGAVGREYSDKVTNGNHLYWIALGWYHLKEFQLAQQQFELFIKNYSSNAWIPKAKFYMAKVEYDMGFNERALKRLKSVISEYPGDPAADMAKLEISQIEKSL